MATKARQIRRHLHRYYVPSLDNSFCLFRWTYHREHVWYPLSFPVVSFSLPPLRQVTSGRGAPVAVERILQVIEFSAKAPWIIKDGVGEPARVSRLIRITVCVQTDGSTRARTHSPLRTVYTRMHASRYCQALGYAALWEAISHHYLAVRAGSLPHYLLARSAVASKQLNPSDWHTATCCCYAGEMSCIRGTISHHCIKRSPVVMFILKGIMEMHLSPRVTSSTSLMI